MSMRILLFFVFTFLFAFSAQAKTQKALFAGGCFWCMQPPFDKAKGVVKTVVGFAGGREVAPKYKDVAAGKTGHVEVVEVRYNPKKTSYPQLLKIFERNIDPTDSAGQFVDRGKQYRPAVFYHSETQKQQVRSWKTALQKSGRFKRPIVVEIAPATSFYPADEGHQNYYKKNPVRYKFYRFGSGRDKFLRKHWKKK